MTGKAPIVARGAFGRCRPTRFRPVPEAEVCKLSRVYIGSGWGGGWSMDPSGASAERGSGAGM